MFIIIAEEILAKGMNITEANGEDYFPLRIKTDKCGLNLNRTEPGDGTGHSDKEIIYW